MTEHGEHTHCRECGDELEQPAYLCERCYAQAIQSIEARGVSND